jgi:hypothetical protein
MDQIKLYNILRTDLELPDERAADFVSALGAVTGTEMNARIQLLATKSDVHALKSDLHSLELKMYKAIFLSGVVQFIAIVASVLAIVKFIQ